MSELYGKVRPARPSPRAEQLAVNQWNTLYRPGQAVKVRRDDGSILETVTESEAWLMGGHSAMVRVRGISGGFKLDRVKGC